MGALHQLGSTTAGLDRGCLIARLAPEGDEGIGQRLAIDRAIEGLPFEVAVIDEGPDLARRSRARVGQHARHADIPLVAVTLPAPFAEASPGVEDPAAHLVAGRIPTDSLFDFDRLLVGPLDRILLDQKAFACAPPTIHADAALLVLILPLADQPFELLEPCVRRRILGLGDGS